jgi:hypothetical protein
MQDLGIDRVAERRRAEVQVVMTPQKSPPPPEILLRGFFRSQSGFQLPLASVQVRVTLVAIREVGFPSE